MEVIWNDAHGGDNSWVDQREVRKDHSPVRVRSVGIVFRHNRKGITLVQSHNPEAQQWDHSLFIPFGNIVSIKDLQPTGKGQK